MIEAFLNVAADDPQKPVALEQSENEEGLTIKIKTNKKNSSTALEKTGGFGVLINQNVGKLNEAFANMVDLAKKELGQRMRRMYKFPASWDEAKVHQRAYMNGFKTPYSVKQEQQVQTETLMCPCCQNFVNTIEIPLSYPTYPLAKQGLGDKQKNKNSDIGGSMQSQYNKKAKIRLDSKDVFQIQAGDALFFCFVKLVITLLVIRFFILDAYNLYTNHLGNYCSLPAQVKSLTVCTVPLIDYFSTPNKSTPQGQPYFVTLDFLNLLLTFVSISFFIYGRIKLYTLYNRLQTWDVTEDDYSVLIEDVPIIPFMRNDARVQDVNQEYHIFIKKVIQNKIRAWLNSFYAYNENDGTYRNHIDRQFFTHVYKQKRESQAEAELYDSIVTSVNLCYDLTQLENIQNSREKLMKDFIETDGKEPDYQYQLFDDELDTGLQKRQYNIGHGYISFVPNQIDILNRHYISVCQKISEGIQFTQDDNGLAIEKLKMSRFVGKAFVSLKYQHFKQYLLYRYERDNQFLRTNGNSVNLKVTKATKPNDINWNNLKVSDEYRATQLRTSYLLVTIALIVSGAILFGLTDLQTKFNTSKKSTLLEHLFLLSLPIWTYLVNYTLNWGLYQLNFYEKHKNKTEQNSELIVKNVASKFFNTAVIYALVYAFGPQVNFLNSNGLVYVIFSLVVVNTGLNLVTQYFQPYYLYLNWSNKKTLQTAKRTGKANLFQIQLNKMVQKPPYPYDNTYSYYLQMIYIICFYGYLVPMIVPIIIVAFSLQYWVDKRNLLRKFSSPVDLGYHLTKKMWVAVELSLLFRVIGHIVWGFYLHHPTALSRIINYICTFISIVYLIIVFVFGTKFEQMIEGWASSDNIFKEPYHMFKQSFSKTYQNTNPATAFVQKKADNETNIFDQVSQYSVMEATRKFKKDHFIPENNEQLRKIWTNKKNETAIFVEQDSIIPADKFTTFLCC